MIFPVIDLTTDPVFNYFFSLVLWPGVFVIHFHLIYDLINRA